MLVFLLCNYYSLVQQNAGITFTLCAVSVLITLIFALLPVVDFFFLISRYNLVIFISDG